MSEKSKAYLYTSSIDPTVRKNWWASSIDEIRKLLDLTEHEKTAKHLIDKSHAEVVDDGNRTIAQLTADRDEQANVIIKLLKEKGELAGTISELRETLEVKNATLRMSCEQHDKIHALLLKQEAYAKLGKLVRGMLKSGNQYEDREIVTALRKAIDHE